MSRYARQMILPEMGAAGQARLRAARCVVVGAGGLAAGALPLLAGAGLGHITVIDGDVVDLSNLHRQTLFDESACGASKAETAARRLQALNSDINVASVSEPLTPANAPGLLKGADLVLDCADSHAVSYILSDVCFAENVPLITASALGFSGYVGGFCGCAPSLRAVFPDAPASGATCATTGVMGPVVTQLGAMQAQMGLATLLDLDPRPLGQMVQLDMRSYHFSAFRFDGAPEPDACFPFLAASQLTSDDLIIELRGVDEAPATLHPDARRLSPSGLSGALAEFGPNSGTLPRLALCCATGLRSWRAAEESVLSWPGQIVLVAASAC